MKTVAIIGSPNAGKTSLFNKIASCQACVGNWAGVSATCKEAKLCSSGANYKIVDLPGTYSLPCLSSPPESESQSQVYNYLQEGKVDLWINVIDITQLKRQLYLTTQLMEMGQDVIVVVNRIDLATTDGIELDIDSLSRSLGVSVVKVSAKIGLGVRSLGLLIKDRVFASRKASNEKVQGLCNYPSALEGVFENYIKSGAKSRYEAICRCLAEVKKGCLPSFIMQPGLKEIVAGLEGGVEEFIARKRYELIDVIHKDCYKKVVFIKDDFTKRMDSWFLHKRLGLALFFAMMFLVFWLSMGFGQFVQSIVEPFWKFLWVDVPGIALAKLHAPAWLLVIITQGVGVSLVTSLSFFPVLFCMFFALYFLEETGYMGRAAIVIDRVMRYLDLPGESLVALILGLGCNVPGVLATKHIGSYTHKVVTSLMMPFMSCSARLTIFAVFSNAFFPESAARVLFFLYCLGIGVACLTGWLLTATGFLIREESSTYLLELPAYQLPSIKHALKVALDKSYQFIIKALGVILPVCVILTILIHISINGEFLSNPGASSFISYAGKMLSSAFYPLGIRPDQWPLIVALITGLIAKEVVITTLGIFYAQGSMYQGVTWYYSHSFDQVFSMCKDSMLESIYYWKNLFYMGPSIEKLAWLSSDLTTGFLSSYHVMSYLIFLLLYFPCISTLYAQARQVGWRWARLSLIWSCFIAYICAAGYLGINLYAPWIKDLSWYWIEGAILYTCLKKAWGFVVDKIDEKNKELAQVKGKANNPI